jgi:clan AA aspartic protease
MITGRINSELKTIVAVSLRDGSGQIHVIDAILDTGFTGSLTLPTAIIAQLGLVWRMKDDATLANGQTEELDVYTARIDWDGSQRTILVQAIDAASLLGMELLDGYDLRARVEVGGVVEIEAIP